MKPNAVSLSSMELIDRPYDARIHPITPGVPSYPLTIQPLRLQASVAFIVIAFVCVCVRMCVHSKWGKTVQQSLPTTVALRLPDLHHFSSAPIHDLPPWHHTQHNTTKTQCKYTHFIWALLYTRGQCIYCIFLSYSSSVELKNEQILQQGDNTVPLPLFLLSGAHIKIMSTVYFQHRSRRAHTLNEKKGGKKKKKHVLPHSSLFSAERQWKVKCQREKLCHSRLKMTCFGEINLDKWNNLLTLTYIQALMIHFLLQLLLKRSFTLTVIHLIKDPLPLCFLIGRTNCVICWRVQQIFSTRIHIYFNVCW